MSWFKKPIDHRDEFEKLIDECSKSNANRLIYNASKEHAVWLTRALLHKALIDHQPVKIITNETDIYDFVIEDIKSILAAKIPVELLLTNPRCADSDLVKALNTLPSGSVKATKTSMVAMNFILIGNSRYRLLGMDGVATANFNSPSIAEVLLDMFEKYKKEIAEGSRRTEVNAGRYNFIKNNMVK